MKQILMTAEISGQPKYGTLYMCPDVLHMHPSHVADHWVLGFISNLAASTELRHNKVTFTLITHGSAHVHRLVQYFDEECAEDVAKFWVPVVTKYISED